MWKGREFFYGVLIIESLCANWLYAQPAPEADSDTAQFKVVSAFYRAGLNSHSIGISYDFYARWLVGRCTEYGGVSLCAGNVIYRVRWGHEYLQYKDRQGDFTLRFGTLRLLKTSGLGLLAIGLLSFGDETLAPELIGTDTIRTRLFGGIGMEQCVVLYPSLKRCPTGAVGFYERMLFGSRAYPPWDVGIKLQAGYKF